MSYTYEQLKPIIVKEEKDDTGMKVEFKAPGQNAPIQAVGPFIPDQKEVIKNVGKTAVKQGVISQGISWIARLVGGSVGGAAGSVAGSATRQVGHAATQNQNDKAMQQSLKVEDTPENRQKAVLKAFESVQQFYSYNSGENTWTYNAPHTPSEN